MDRPQSNLKTIILPVEIKNRELDAMILLACALAERGCRVFVGDRRKIKVNIHDFPASLFLGKSVTGDIYKLYRYLRRLGHTVTALDEEGLVIYSEQIYKTRRVDIKTLRSTEALFAWGEENAGIWKSCLTNEEAQHRIFITGNPRFDLLRTPLREIYRPASQKLAELYGPYVLFNSNFHWVNTRQQFYTRLPDPDDVASGKIAVPPFYNAELARYRIGLFRAYLEALPRLAAELPEVNFVVRPHPAENPATWENACEGLSNCYVIHEGEVAPWILGSQVVLHHSCTTAVEAFVMGKPVISYRPLENQELDPQLPIRLSRQARSFLQLRSLLKESIRPTPGDPDQAGQQSYLEQHAAALKGELACDRIARIMADLPIQAPPIHQRIAGRVHLHRKRIQRRIKALKGQPVRQGNPHIFPPTSLQSVRDRVNRYGELLDRFATVEVAEVAPNLFRFLADVE